MRAFQLHDKRNWNTQPHSFPPLLLLPDEKWVILSVDVADFSDPAVTLDVFLRFSYDDQNTWKPWLAWRTSGTAGGIIDSDGSSLAYYERLLKLVGSTTRWVEGYFLLSEASRIDLHAALLTEAEENLRPIPGEVWTRL